MKKIKINTTNSDSAGIKSKLIQIYIADSSTSKLPGTVENVMVLFLPACLWCFCCYNPGNTKNIILVLWTLIALPLEV